jgi:hypothetical protein
VTRPDGKGVGVAEPADRVVARTTVDLVPGTFPSQVVSAVAGPAARPTTPSGAKAINGRPDPRGTEGRGGHRTVAS